VTVIRRFGILMLGIVVLLLGVWQFVWSDVEVTNVRFGWTAYAPLSNTTYSPTPSSLPIALMLIVAGFALIAGWCAVGVGRRTPEAGAVRRFVPAGIGILILVIIAVTLFASTPGDYGYGYTSYGGLPPYVQFEPPHITIGDIVGALILSAAFGSIAWWVGEQIGRRGGRAVSRPSQA
jgi:hypothetical protein